MDRVRMRILGRVAAKWGENPHRRRGQGSSAMFVSRGLVGPNMSLNRGRGKGSGLIFPHRASPCPSRDASRQSERACLYAQAWKSGESRHGENRMKTRVGEVKASLRPILGARENRDGVNLCVRTKN